MKTSKKPRWMQRYDNFRKALKKITDVTLTVENAEALSDLESEGLVQRFEYTFELAWKTLQDLLRERGYDITPGPNPVLQKSFEDGLIGDHDGWRKMLKARNTTSHIYDENEVKEIVNEIFNTYTDLFLQLDLKLQHEL